MSNHRLYRWIYNLIILLLLLTGVFFVVSEFVHFGHVEFTDNATVCRHITPVNARVGGFIKEIRFEEYHHVHRGDTLVIIEDSEFRLRLAQALSELENALSGGGAEQTGIQTTRENMKVLQSAVEEARVKMENAQREDARYAELLKSESVTLQEADRVHTLWLAAKARYDQAVRALSPLESALGEQRHRVAGRQAGIEAARSAVELARLNLSYTAIIATADGVVGKKDIHVGQLVAPGQTLVEIVDDSDLWVTANFRETQLQHIAPGATVEVSVDAFPDKKWEGTVERISDATGSSFSLIPQDNATGNFVKIEQRIPVRIRLKDAKQAGGLRAGMSAECEVRW